MIEQFIQTISNPNTADAYSRDVQRFLDWLGEDKLAELEPEDVLNYVAYLRDDGLEASSINRKLSSIRAFLRWAVLTKRARPEVFSAAQAVRGVKAPKRLPRPLTPAEVEKLLAQPNLTTLAGARDFAFINFLLATGVRLAEAIALNVEDLQFDEDGGQVVVWGKGSKERPVFFDVEAASALVYYLGLRGNPQGGPLFTNEHGDRISHRWMQRALKAYGDAVGIEVHPHKLRRTFAVDALNATRDIKSVSALLGHEDIRTTEIYTKMATDHLKEVSRAVATRRGRGRAVHGTLTVPEPAHSVVWR